MSIVQIVHNQELLFWTRANHKDSDSTVQMTCEIFRSVPKGCTGPELMMMESQWANG